MPRGLHLAPPDASLPLALLRVPSSSSRAFFLAPRRGAAAGAGAASASAAPSLAANAHRVKRHGGLFHQFQPHGDLLISRHVPRGQWATPTVASRPPGPGHIDEDLALMQSQLVSGSRLNAATVVAPTTMAAPRPDRDHPGGTPQRAQQQQQQFMHSQAAAQLQHQQHQQQRVFRTSAATAATTTVTTAAPAPPVTPRHHHQAPPSASPPPPPAPPQPPTATTVRTPLHQTVIPHLRGLPARRPPPRPTFSSTSSRTHPRTASHSSAETDSDDEQRRHHHTAHHHTTHHYPSSGSNSSSRRHSGARRSAAALAHPLISMDDSDAEDDSEREANEYAARGHGSGADSSLSEQHVYTSRDDSDRSVSSEEEEDENEWRSDGASRSSYGEEEEGLEEESREEDDEAAAVLSMLREQLTGPEQRASAIVTADECGAALLDLVSVLLLLDEDVRQALPGSVVLFQPVLDLRNKLAAFARATMAGQHHHQHAGNYQQHGGAAMPRLQHAAWQAPGGSGGGGAGGSPQVAVLVTRARCAKLLSQQPACCIAATLHMDCSEIAGVIASTIETQGSTRLRVASSPEGLVAAWRALRGARALVRARTAGQKDVLVTPHMVVEPSPSAPPGASRASRSASPSPQPPRGAGSRSSQGRGASPPPQQQQQQQQQAVMFFNVWLR